MYTDNSQPAAVRGTHLLVDALEAVHDELLAVAIDQEVADPAAPRPATNASLTNPASRCRRTAVAVSARSRQA